MGKSTPVSLFAHMMETIAVSGRMALSSSARSIWPLASTPSQVTSWPRLASLSQCLSDGAVLDARGDDVLPVGSMRQRGPDGRVIDSVPQLVKIISRGSQPRRAATCARACSRPSPERLPKL